MTEILTPVSRQRLPRDPVALAKALIGFHLVRELEGERSVGRIVETEAYLEDDEASHSFRGKTARNGAMFFTRGHAYIYRIYGLYWCVNVSAGAEGEGAAVLLRAAEPVEGLDAMSKRRNHRPLLELARGPGRLAAAFAIDRSLDAIDLCQPGPLWLAKGSFKGTLGESTRIGITRAADARLRFFERGNAFVSGTKAINT